MQLNKKKIEIKFTITYMYIEFHEFFLNAQLSAASFSI